MEAIKKHLQDEIREIANKIRINAIKVIEDKEMVITGHLRNSIQTKTVINDNEAVITVFVAEGGKLKGSTKYPKFLHEGIEPHMPPIDPIKEWVRKKGIVKDDVNQTWLKVKNTRNRPTKQKMIEQKINSAAWAIAMNMKKKGRKPTPFLDIAVKMTLKTLS
ncbi:MAG: hypothetical protein WC155_08525 [Candidatus Cloacimonadales bacterium]